METQTLTVVKDLRAATAAAQVGTLGRARLPGRAGRRPAQRAGQPARAADRAGEQRVSCRRGDLPGLQARRRPAASPTTIMPVGGALAGLALGCLIAVLLERLRGVVRSAARGGGGGPAGRRRRPAQPLARPAARARRRPRPSTPPSGDCVPRSWTSTRGRTSSPSPRRAPGSPTPTSPRRWRSRSPRPATAWCSSGPTDSRPRRRPGGRGAGPGPGPAPRAAERAGHAAAQRGAAPLPAPRRRVHRPEPRAARSPTGCARRSPRSIEAGHLVVIQSPGIDSAEGEAIVGAADLGLVVVTAGRTRPRDVEQVAQVRTRGVALAALVVGPKGSSRRARRAARSTNRLQDIDSDAAQEGAVTHDPLTRTRR